VSETVLNPIQCVRGASPTSWKQPRREADHSPPSGTEVKKMYNLAFTHPYNFTSSTGTTLLYIYVYTYTAASGRQPVRILQKNNTEMLCAVTLQLRRIFYLLLTPEEKRVTLPRKVGIRLSSIQCHIKEERKCQLYRCENLITSTERNAVFLFSFLTWL